MAKLRGRKPWPSETSGHYYILSENVTIIKQLLHLCLIEGTVGDNGDLIYELLPKIYLRVEVIKDSCVALRSFVRPLPRGGSEPKWARIALDIHSICLTILEQLKLVEEELDERRFITVGHLLKLATNEISKIIDMLNLLPVEDDPTIPEIFREALETMDNDDS
jgi:hypothetical protein